MTEQEGVIKYQLDHKTRDLPQDFNFSQTIHAADERIPIEAVTFGTNAIYEVLKRFK